MTRRIGAIVLMVLTGIGRQALGQPCPTNVPSPQFLNSNASFDAGIGDGEPQVGTDRQDTWIVVWRSCSGDCDLTFSRSTDDGITWSTQGFLNTDAASDYYPQDDFAPDLATDSQGNWVAVWVKHESGGYRHIRFSRSQDNGETWTSPEPLSAAFDGDIDEYPQVATDGNGTWITVWRTNDGSGDALGILSSRSIDNGASWTDEAAVAVGEFSYPSPALDTDGSGTWVIAWPGSSFSGPDSDILFARSTDNGDTWSPAMLLNSAGMADTATDYKPRLTTDGLGNWVAVWELSFGITGSDRDIFFATSSDNGVTWSDPAPINYWAGTDDSSVHDEDAQIVYDGQGTWMTVWHSGIGSITSDEDIWTSISLSDGTSWVATAPLNTTAFDGNDNSIDDTAPSLGTDSQGTWVAVWQVYSGAYYCNPICDPDIYFVRFQLGAPVDCNFNDFPDECDVTNGLSVDCNQSGIPDECEADCNSNGIHDACDVASQTSDDCDGDETPDECGVTYVVEESGQLGPIGAGSPQTYTLASSAEPGGEVLLSFTARADLGAPLEAIDVRINGVLIGTVFETTGNDCPAIPDQATLLVYAPGFYDFAVGGDAFIEMIPTAAVNSDPGLCDSFISVRVEYHASTDLDCNGTGIPDACDLYQGASEDLDGNGIPDECEIVCIGDVDLDSDVGPEDLAVLLGSWGRTGVADFNKDGSVNPLDLAILLINWGPC